MNGQPPVGWRLAYLGEYVGPGRDYMVELDSGAILGPLVANEPFSITHTQPTASVVYVRQ